MKLIVNIACDLLLTSFIWVAAVVRWLLPSSMRRRRSVDETTVCLERPSTNGPV